MIVISWKKAGVTGVLRSRFIAGVSSGRIKKYKNMGPDYWGMMQTPAYNYRSVSQKL
jgi:hypothetical protein